MDFEDNRVFFVLRSCLPPSLSLVFSFYTFSATWLLYCRVHDFQDTHVIFTRQVHASTCTPIPLNQYMTAPRTCRRHYFVGNQVSTCVSQRFSINVHPNTPIIPRAACTSECHDFADNRALSLFNVRTTLPHPCQHPLL